MTCDHAIELLPWYLNGTLEPTEGNDVQRHLGTCERCRSALAETREVWPVFAQHLPVEDLTALAWGEKPSGTDAATAEEHLAACPQCAAELELVRTSRRLEEEDNVALFPVVKRRPETAAAPRTWRSAAIAAGLAAVVASGGWLYTARQAGQVPAPAGQVAQAGGLAPTALVDLGTGDVVRAGEPRTLPGDRSSTLLLTVKDAGTAPLAAEVVDEAGTVTARFPLIPGDLGTYSILLPARSLKRGLYKVRLAGRDEAWTFRIGA